MIRHELAKPLIKSIIKQIKSHCSVCSKLNNVCDKCRERIKFWQLACIAGLPRKKVQWFYKKIPIHELTIAEYDFNKRNLKTKPIDLYKQLILPFSKKFNIAMEEGYSLMFCGKNSAGKTLSATKLALKLLAKGYSVYYLTFLRLHNIHTGTFGNNAEEMIELLNEIQNVDFLIVDELEKKTNQTNSTIRLADTYLKAREESLKPTLLITNCTVKELDTTDNPNNGYGPSFWAMLGESYRIFQFSPKIHDLRIANRSSWKL